MERNRSYGAGMAEGPVHDCQDLPGDLTRLSDLEEYELADYAEDPRGWKLRAPGGEEIGEIEGLIASPSRGKALFAVVEAGSWLSPRRVALPLDRVRFNPQNREALSAYQRDRFEAAPEWNEEFPDFAAYCAYWTGDLRSPETAAGEMRVPLREEVADVHKERREAGSLILRKRVVTETRQISEPVSQTRVSVELRELEPGAPYDAAGATPLEEGETLRVPVMQEELTVDKQPRVTREAVVRTMRDTDQVERDIDLSREEVDVDTAGEVEYDSPSLSGGRR